MTLKKASVVTVAALAIGIAFPYINLAIDNVYQQLRVITDVMEIIRENYVEEVKPQKLAYGAARGMVAELDDFSQFMEPDLYDRVKSDTEGEFGGIGIRIDVREKWLTIVTPLPDTPAYRAGLYPGDKIIKIEGESTRDMLIDEAVKKLRGKPGTKVNITIAREPEDKNSDWTELEVPLVREIIMNESVKQRVLEDKFGYIKILDFNGHTVEDFGKALKGLKKKGIEGLVLDLRYNPGGLLNAAVDVSKMFIGSRKMIVFTKGRKPENYQEFHADEKAEYSDLPLIVLINRYSASASEIVAGAVQDNKRGIVLGERSFGKASVQSMIPLSDKSALRLTIAKYYTPSGRSIQRADSRLSEKDKDKTEKDAELKDKEKEEDAHLGGILPDIEVKVPLEEEKKLLKQSEELLYPDEKKEKKGKDKKADKDKKKSSSDSGFKPEEGEEVVRDQILDRAVELLKAREALAVIGG